MAAIVYNTRYDPAYRNAEAEIQAPVAETNITDISANEIKPLPKTDMEKYFFMAVIIIGLGVLIYKMKFK